MIKQLWLCIAVGNHFPRGVSALGRVSQGWMLTPDGSRFLSRGVGHRGCRAHQETPETLEESELGLNVDGGPHIPGPPPPPPEARVFLDTLMHVLYIGMPSQILPSPNVGWRLSHRCTGRR